MRESEGQSHAWVTNTLPWESKRKEDRHGPALSVLILYCLAILAALRPQATYSLTIHFDLFSVMRQSFAA